MKKLLLFMLSAMLLPMYAFGQQDSYKWRPFIEPDKIWSYKILSGDLPNKINDEYYAHFSVGDKIEGGFYDCGYEKYPCFVTTTHPDFESYEEPFCYLILTVTGDVLCSINPDFQHSEYPWKFIRRSTPLKTYCIYSNSAPLISSEFVRSYDYLDPTEIRVSKVQTQTPSGTALRGYKIDLDETYEVYLYEGLGYIMNDYFASLFMLSNPLTTGWGEYFQPYLYEVKEADGTVLYRDESVAPQDGVEYVSLSEDEAEAKYIDLQGRTVAEPSNGVYIRRDAATARKVLVR